MPSSQRSKRLRYRAPDAGIYGFMVVQLLQRNPNWAWPCSEIVASIDLPERSTWYALQNLLRLGLIEKRSRDTVIRVRLTAAGRRYQRPRHR